MLLANDILPFVLNLGEAFRLIWLKQLDISNCWPIKAIFGANFILPGSVSMEDGICDVAIGGSLGSGGIPRSDAMAFPARYSGLSCATAQSPIW
jgi:hypothetical protein